MAAHPGLLEVGRIHKPHGLRGELAVSLVTNRLERVEPGSILEVDDEHGEARRLEVAASRPHQGRWLICFVGVDHRDEADRLRGRPLYAEPVEDPDELWVHELVGAEVRDRVGAVLGTVEAVEANPASDLLVLGDGGLVPLRFVVEGPTDGVVVVDVPAGLLDG